MRLVIQCAGSKRADAGTFDTTDGRRVVFVADAASAPPAEGILHAHPDSLVDEMSGKPGETWRDRVIAANAGGTTTRGALLPVWQLYTPSAYGRLKAAFGDDGLFILSAGWGLVRADYRLPAYDITFSVAAGRCFRRRSGQRFLDFNALAETWRDDTVFLGGRSYLPLFLLLTQDIAGRRLVIHNSDRAPSAPGCSLQRFRTRRRTNWHYTCAEALAAGCFVPTWDS
jgi:hypothetical protein